ncbi:MULTISPECIES: type II toxin-antitoxin system VapC family toxin [Metallosphaera]|uniref:PIN domain-containing protein n=2 Tax=Metallosphaera TaxID=41980 RepID=A0A0K1SLQ9_9CREN|nr:MULTISPECIES: type II toxin-antitoxin system VapC family toxin [Metallosphaera]AKV73475.1 hypothetical protein MsedA_0329 [Metallosphaera sedula]AKV75717.1 hypothetical protein MsedB_0329 [Metallosphaera sedula]AKV77964.1 hypothetical protein MsedC_0328 [Metallosphaera sedula]AKV80209.1 hypothetical protein MsedD_0329 [Metallosphaera sedula]AKV82455.1 hypothetical protein MsedE_0329 [Metallosphaera sedula]
MKEIVLLDTSSIYAIFNKGDPNHVRASQLLREIEELRFGQPTICDYVVDETLTLVFQGMERVMPS